MGLLFLIIVLVLCIAITGFFSGSEMAIVHADNIKLNKKAASGSHGAQIAKKLLNDPARFFSITLLGTNLAKVTASVITTYYIYSNYGEGFVPFAILLSPITLVFSELVPKSLYQHYADRLAVTVSPILELFGKIFSPIIKILTKFTRTFLGEIEGLDSKQDGLSRDDLEVMLDMSEEAYTDLKPKERTMINKIFDLAEKTAENIMIPLVDIALVSSDTSRDKAVKLLEMKGVSRLPVHEGPVYNIVGFIDDTDLIFSDEETTINQLVKETIYVPEVMPLDELLIAMKRKGISLAIVVDEYGAATGIVTVEDIFEEVVGEIQDEFDYTPPMYKRIGHRRFLVAGRMEIEKANDKLKLEIPDGDYETMAGFLLTHFEKIPEVGDSINIGGWSYAITKSTDRVIEEVEIKKI